ncbi:MAG: hypothetical protein H6621_03255 [Halobacteriovoraceae bacterium]|nr:hypothetical protein [Halobacteriovoraceae bacterium]MCB9094064.1 hypothetical protein [Halobacteriovoraceae bacterium]
MKRFILFSFLISVTALSASEITEKNVLEQLMGIHGASWSSLIKSDDDKAQIKSILTQVIEQNLDPVSYGYKPEYTSMIRQNAFTEYGNFVETNDKGNIDKSDKKLIEKYGEEAMQEGPDSHSALAYYGGLTNIGSPESLELLSRYLDETESLSTLHAIGRQLTSALQGQSNEPRDPSLDLSYINPYNPNTKDPFTKRKGNWKKVIPKIQKRLKKARDLALSKSKSDSFKKSFTELSNKMDGYEKDLSKIKVTEVDQKKKEETTRAVAMDNFEASDSLKDKIQDSDRQTASLEEDEEVPAKENSSLLYIVSFLLAIIVGIALYKKLFT